MEQKLKDTKILTRSKGKKNAEALEDLLPAFKATALPCQSITGEPLEPPLVPEAAWFITFIGGKKLRQ